jgi:hypothetical protein
MQLMAFTDEQLRLIGEIAQPVPIGAAQSLSRSRHRAAVWPGIW